MCYRYAIWDQFILSGLWVIILILNGGPIMWTCVWILKGNGWINSKSYDKGHMGDF